MHKDPFIKESFMESRLPHPVRARSPRSALVPAALMELSTHFEGLANPTRIKIVERLAAAAEVRVSELADLCKVSQPRMSWHLRILRRSQVIRTRREGREVFCRLDRDAIAAHLRSFARLLTPGGEIFDMQPVSSEVAQ
ncbi:MAG: helix-turn-helix transcriptional regulator [Chloroflexi bacterium]|nr:MAG: helix-turn-helix transcriptional regulator [Chloroflexota bacterium]